MCKAVPSWQDQTDRTKRRYSNDFVYKLVHNDVIPSTISDWFLIGRTLPRTQNHWYPHQGGRPLEERCPF